MDVLVALLQLIASEVKTQEFQLNLPDNTEAYQAHDNWYFDSTTMIRQRCMWPILWGMMYTIYLNQRNYINSINSIEFDDLNNN